MANDFRGRGNLGSAPTLKQVEVDGELRSVAQLRVYFDRSVPDGDGGFVDRGGFWLDVSVWGAKGEAAARILRKGARVSVSGTLVNQEWTDKESGETRSRLELRADNVDLDLLRVDNVQWQIRNQDDGKETEQD